MSVKTTYGDDHLYFITFTCFRWIKLFEITDGYKFVYKWFEYLRIKRVNVIAYVIMPNHAHIILHLGDQSMSLNTIIGNGKRFLAYAMIKVLENEMRDDILDVLYFHVTPKERSKGQRYRVFEKSFDAKVIYSEDFLIQKINYIHHNPVRGRWHLVDDYTQYPHSSSSFYEFGNSQVFQPMHFKDIT